jgi:trans-aconitate methyltransferase
MKRHGGGVLSIKNHFSLSPDEYAALRAGHLERRRQTMVEAALRAQGQAAPSVLEIGAGTGASLAAIAARFPSAQCLGIDVAPDMVAYARERYQAANLRYELADITTLASSPAFDFVYSIDVLHHLHEPLACFQAVRRALHPGGRWLAIEPNIYHPYIYLHQERMRRAGFDEDHFRPWVMEPLMAHAGLTIAARRYAFLIPGWLKQPAALLQGVEATLEHLRFVGGSVVYLLHAT